MKRTYENGLSFTATESTHHRCSPYPSHFNSSSASGRFPPPSHVVCRRLSQKAKEIGMSLFHGFRFVFPSLARWWLVGLKTTVLMMRMIAPILYE
jgi:hypothetical protein